MGITEAPQQLVPPQLLTEALGFSPQLLLDDIINQRAQLDDDDGTQEVEQGLVAFQTLLEFHTDVAFDFFEAWSLRNIFATPECEQELMDEVEELRNQIENLIVYKQRRLRHHLKRANHRQTIELRRARKMFDSLAAYETTVDAVRLLPDQLMAMHSSISTLPELEPATISALPSSGRRGGKRQWEMGKTEEGGGELLPDIANAEMFRKASEVMDGVSRSLETSRNLETGDEDVAMED
ncbi:hypothetical protein B0H10DRAFT_2441763 [Mycena sp. CBHHK59/15]|nr:hypothetical protein B0H10DRAFT_2441763 [Mycena sp. CBHHK59/15]